MSEKRFSRESLAGATAMLVYLALLKVVMHLLTAGNYGYFRDEFYYIAAGGRLDLGYVEFPPLVTVVANLSRFLLGDSQVALRFLPTLARALVVVLAGVIARELGGGRFAQGADVLGEQLRLPHCHEPTVAWHLRLAPHVEEPLLTPAAWQPLVP